MASRRLRKMCKASTPSFNAGITADRLLGPYSLPSCLTGAVYHDFRRNELPELLQHVDLQTRTHWRFMHDGIPQHSLLAFQEFLNNVFPDQWMGWGGPTVVPLTYIPYIFISADIWSLLLCYNRQWLPGLATTKQNGFETTSTILGIFHQVRQSLFRSVTSCVEAQGGYLEHFP
jgi:hypothetical protein